MEERVPLPPSSRHDHHHDHNHDPDPDPDPDPDVSLPSETYVVQVPKDQIYRVPPPENAIIVERYRKPAKARSHGRGSCSCCCCCCSGWMCCVVLALVVVIFVGLAIIVDLFSVLAKAKDPVFHVESFHAKNVTFGHEFNVGFTAENLNKYSDVVYKQGGVSSLMFKQKKIASGIFPAFLQNRKSASNVKFTLHDSGRKLPAEVVTGMSSKKAGPPLSFTLRMTVTVRMSARFFRQHEVDLSISCDYTTDKLTGGTHILSEECVVEHG